MCVDYHALNKLTIKNKFPNPLVIDLFDRVSRVSHFSKLNLQFGYQQVWIVEEDERKTI